MAGKKRKIADTVPDDVESVGRAAADDPLDDEDLVDVPDQAEGDDGGLEDGEGGIIADDDEEAELTSDGELAARGEEEDEEEDSGDEDGYLDPFEDDLNPDSQDQRFHAYSSGSDSEISEYEDEVSTLTKRKGKSRAAIGGAERPTAGRGRGRGRGGKRGRPRGTAGNHDVAVASEEDDEAAGDEFEDLVASIQTHDPTTEGSLPNHRSKNTSQTSAIAADMLQIRDELAQAAGFKKKNRRGGAGSSRRAPRERIHSKEINELIGEGNAAWGMGDLNTARTHMWEVIRLDSTVDEAWMTLASIFREEGKLEKEMACLFTAAHCKKDAETWRDLADRIETQGRWEQAVYCMNRAVRTEPGDKGMVFTQAQVLRKAGMLEKSWKAFQSLLKETPYDIFLLKETLDLFHPLGRIGDGIQYFDDAFRYHTQTFSGPNDTTTASDYSNALDYEFVNSLTDLFLAGGDQWDEAGRTIKRAQRWFQGRREEDFWDTQQDDAEYDPENAGRLDATAERDGVPGAGDNSGGYSLPNFMRWRLAIVRLKMGWDLDARIHADEFLKEDSVESLRSNHQGWSNLGLAMMQRGMFSKARVIYEDLWEKLLASLSLNEADLMDPDWIARAGTCRLEEKMYIDAIEAFDLVLEHQRDSYDGWRDPDIMRQKARAYVGLKDIATADQIFTEIRMVEREQAITAGQQEGEEQPQEDGDALIPTRKRPSRVQRKTTGMTRREREEAEATQAGENLELLQEVQDAAAAGDEEAVETYIETAGSMVALFRASAGLFPAEKGKRFVKADKESKLKTGFQTGPLVAVEDADGETTVLAQMQRVEFQGIHADVWIGIFVRYCCLLMLRGEEPAAMDILDHVSWSTLFEPTKYVLAIQLTTLAAAIRLEDQEHIGKACRIILVKYQFRRDPLAIWQAAVGTGLRALEAAINLNLQKALYRDLQIWEAAVAGKEMRYNSSAERYIWRKSASDHVELANKLARRELRAQRKNAYKEQAMAKGRDQPKKAQSRKAGKTTVSRDQSPSAHSDEGSGLEDEPENHGLDQDANDEDNVSENFDEQDEDDEEGHPAEDAGQLDTQRSTGESDFIEPSGGYQAPPAYPKPKEVPAHMYMAYGQELQMAKSYQPAIYYFLKAYKANPYDPLLCLHTAQAYFGRAMNRQSDNRLNQISTGMAFLSRYRRLMQFQNEGDWQLDEVEYNFGRAFHGLGILHLAVKHYQTVLARIAARMITSGNPDAERCTSVARDTAYNLCLIFQLTGAQALGQAVAREWLTI